MEQISVGYLELTEDLSQRLPVRANLFFLFILFYVRRSDSEHMQ